MMCHVNCIFQSSVDSYTTVVLILGLTQLIYTMVELFGSDVVETEYHVRKTKGVHARFGWLKADFKKNLQEAT